MSLFDNSDLAEKCRSYTASSDYCLDDACKSTNALWKECCEQTNYCEWYMTVEVAIAVICILVFLFFCGIVGSIVSCVCTGICCCARAAAGEDGDLEGLELDYETESLTKDSELKMS